MIAFVVRPEVMAYAVASGFNQVVGNLVETDAASWYRQLRNGPDTSAFLDLPNELGHVFISGHGK
jgi:hypothetical protein